MKLNERSGWMGYWPSGGWRALLDPENARIKSFLIEQSKELEGVLLLDAGAGRRPYKAIFDRCRYESTDMPGGFYPEAHTFECFLDSIPKPDSTYDVVVMTQVLEHVPNPSAVMREVFRVLKPNGKLLLSVPLNAPLHGEPWHFFQFTHHGIGQLADEIGFVVAEVEKIGGSFWNLGKRFPDAFRKLMKQYDPFRAKKRKMSVLHCWLMSVLLLPAWMFVYLPAAYLLRPCFYWLDYLDLEKSFTLGYTVVFVKPE